MKIYLHFLQTILDHGVLKQDRTGVGTLSLFGAQMRFNLKAGFPLLTTKKIHIKSVVHELIWFLQGKTNIEYLQTHGVRIWNEWANAAGDLGPVYGKQWRCWETADGRMIDQIADVIARIKQDPDSRRLIVNAWNVGDIDKMALPPCHLLFQFYVANNTLSCQLYQRSADAFLGVPFNIAEYALLTHMVAAQCGLEVGEFVWTGGDCHIYTNHRDVVAQQLSREPLPLPTLRLASRNSIFDYVFEDVAFDHYVCHETLKAPVAV